jgi:hypothetical protein
MLVVLDRGARLEFGFDAPGPRLDVLKREMAERVMAADAAAVYERLTRS